MIIVFIAYAQLRALFSKVWRPIVQVIWKMQLRKCKKGKPLYSMRAVAFKYGILPTTLHDNSMACCSVLVHVLFSAMLSCSFSPVHPWRARKSSWQGARDVPIHENLLAGCYFARACLFGNPRPLEFLT